MSALVGLSGLSEIKGAQAAMSAGKAAKTLGSNGVAKAAARTFPRPADYLKNLPGGGGKKFNPPRGTDILGPASKGPATRSGSGRKSRAPDTMGPRGALTKDRLHPPDTEETEREAPEVIPSREREPVSHEQMSTASPPSPAGVERVPQGSLPQLQWQPDDHFISFL